MRTIGALLTGALLLGGSCYRKDPASPPPSSKPQASPETDPVSLLLDYLLRHQLADGSWGAQPKGCTCARFGRECTSRGERARVTGRVLAAFLEAGFSDLSKDVIEGHPVGPALARAATWLDQTLEADAGTLEDRLLGAYGLSELYALTGQARWKPAADRASSLADHAEAKSAREMIWKGAVLWSASTNDPKRNIVTPLTDLHERLRSMESLTARAGSILLGSCADLAIPQAAFKDLLALRLEDLTDEELHLVVIASHSMSNGDAWHAWYWKAKAHASLGQAVERSESECGSWPGDEGHNRIERSVIKGNMMMHYRCFYCRSVFRKAR